MPHLFPFASHGSGEHNTTTTVQEMEQDRPHKVHRRAPSLLRGLGGLLKRHHDHDLPRDIVEAPQTAPTEVASTGDYFGPTRRRSSEEVVAASKRAIPSLPRPQTFRRQESEKREKLQLNEPSPTEKRTLSVDRRRGLSASAARRPSSPIVPFPSFSISSIDPTNQPPPTQLELQSSSNGLRSTRGPPEGLPPLQIPDQPQFNSDVFMEDDQPEDDQRSIRDEYERSWILNLSMHFRDKSNREKFFVTYAEKPNKWRRITLSLDYRDAPDGSLEADISTLHYQRDKSFRIYEAIRESLPEIQYYDTVTNLKLETTRDDCQLHVHVREDANEIIQYPALSLFSHVITPLYREGQLEFISHLSGFVYKVLADGMVVIKKEIPGPDTVDEFLYEVNALDALVDCPNVVQLQGLVTDESGSVVKGLLIGYASQGALVDMLYDFRGTSELPWYRREKWAKQILQGLTEVHEAGFVQGDFTLSNIVIDADDNALIIDINRRGCPVGWEPPELSRLIESGQRIGMHIGVKTDLFQLGMVLWALAEEIDEPERVRRPLPAVNLDVPDYVQQIIDICLSGRPRDRAEAKELLRLFPALAGGAPSRAGRSVDFGQHKQAINDSVSTHRSDKEYIDPDMAVTLDEVRRPRPEHSRASDFTSAVTYVDPDSNPASSYRFTSTGSWVDVEHRRGRSPVSSRRRRSSPYGRSASSATSVSVSSETFERVRDVPGREHRDGGERCRVEEIGDETLRSEYPPAIDDDDCLPPLPPSSTDLLSEVRIAHQQELMRNKQLELMHQQEEASQIPLLHTDSGFDETMIDELEVQPGPATNSYDTNRHNIGCTLLTGKVMDVVQAREHAGSATEPKDMRHGELEDEQKL
ncbi:hypothetical protein LTR78_001564 [Recurvomyces mirabilis]|uniref:Protein kinase domain-containing protein n=1 Tax=Recurvomyces mirabilis TaxID=574656 RepID=A0AAE0WUW7_9PEZI|nr:hypothetical protein LTR78_001564 [Recurvomyces mirabilis]KAK5151863.1 hypothetical protein LTS14_008997 [Recurvomyces mirabilis]